MGRNIKVAFIMLLLSFVYTGTYGDMQEFVMNRYSTKTGNSQYRLLDNVRPTYMYISLDVFLSASVFTGTVTINVEVSETLQQIVLHQSVAKINAVNVVDKNNRQVDLKFPNSFETDSYYQVLKINFASSITAGQYKIKITYVGLINKNPYDNGFYKGYYFQGDYFHNKTVREYATTQFQPYHARKAFPCFDEPEFKCPFVISITRDAYLSPTISNMAINTTEEVVPGRIRETFLPTPTMSSYLVAFLVSDFVATEISSTPEKPFRIISRQGATDQHAYAAKVGVRITQELADYLDISYYKMGQGIPMKNDHIALPDFTYGGMENWGIVNYREAFLLYDSKDTNSVDEIFITITIAHELANKWFGNLVACSWWSNLWLNEAFASFLEYFATRRVIKSLELDDRFILDRVQSALSADVSPGIQPMNWTVVESNPTIDAHFDTPSFGKGASVLRMMQHFVGYYTFRNVLRYYLNDNAYSIGYPVDIYNAFREACIEPVYQTTYPDIDAGDVFESWVQNPGAPVVNVEVNMETGRITLIQERFQISGTIPETIWHIPITWTSGRNPNFNNLKPSFVFSNKTMSIQQDAGQNWVILNIQHSGYYRVNYDDHNWEMIASQLRRNKDVIHKLNRAQIANDVIFFLRANKISVERTFDVLSFLKNESDYYVWNGVLSQLDWIRRRLEYIPTAHAEFDAYLLELLEGAVQQLGFRESLTDSISIIQSRMQIMDYACQLGHKECICYSLDKWMKFKEDAENLNEVFMKYEVKGNYLTQMIDRVPKNARHYVYCTGLRYGDASDYEFLFEIYSISENAADMAVTLRALACTRHKESLENYLNASMHHLLIRNHDKTNAFEYALLGNKENRGIVLDFLFKNYAAIRQAYGGQERLDVCIKALANYLTNLEHIDAFHSWLYVDRPSLDTAYLSAIRVVEHAIDNIKWAKDKAPEILTAIKRKNKNDDAHDAVNFSPWLLIISLSIAFVAYIRVLVYH